MSLAPLPINSTVGSLSHGCWKRKGSDNEDESCDVRSKKAKYSWYVTLESESPQQSDEDDDNESIYSLQEKETEYVRDTSDTSTHTWVTSSDNDMSVHVEYEVASLSEKENPFPDDSSSSDPEDMVTMGVIAAICDSDLGLADDSEDSRSSVDSEIGKADYWTCIRCNTRNNNPLFRYCEKCFQIRKNFFPPRPKWRRRRRSRREANKSRTRKTTEFDKIHELPESATDSGFFSSQGSKLSFSLSTPFTKDLTGDAHCDSETGCGAIPECTEALEATEKETVHERLEPVEISKEVLKSEDAALIKKNEDISKTHTNSDSTSTTCLTCTVNPKNGAFLHGSVLHICCCYRCAVKIWRNSGSCPICNRKVTNVLKAFYV